MTSAVAVLVPKNLVARKLRSMLTMLGIVLGVALILGTLSITETAVRGIEQSFSNAYGRTDLVVSPEGEGVFVSERTVARVRTVDGVDVATARLSLFVEALLPGGESEQVLALGTDPRTAETAANDRLVAGRRPESGLEANLEERFAQANGLEVGSTLRLAGDGGTRSFTVVGLVELVGGLKAPFHFVYVPLATAQDVFEKRGLVSEVNVVVEDPAEVEAVRKRLREAFGAGWSVETPAAKSEEITEQFQWFNVFVSLFGGIALFVGAFLIFNAFSMTVVQRTRELGLLRAVGGRRRSLLALILAEALALGLVGSALGLALGFLLARALAWLMGWAFEVPVGDVFVPLGAVAGAAVAGVLTALVAALHPALRASRVTPLEALRDRQDRRPGPVARYGWIPGLVLVAAGIPAIVFMIRTGEAGAVLSFLLLPVVLLGVVLATPKLVGPLARALAAPLRAAFGIEGRLAGENVQRNRTRTAITTSGLMIAFALLVTFAAIAASWLAGLRENWLQGLKSDLIVEPKELVGPQLAGFSPELTRRIRGLPETERVAAERIVPARSLGQFAAVNAVDPDDYAAIFELPVVRGREDPFETLGPTEAVASSHLAEERGWKPGTAVTLPGPRGALRLDLVAIVQDAWGSLVYAPRESVEAAFGRGPDSFLYVAARSPDDRAELEAKIERLLRSYPQLEVVSNAEFKDKVDDLVQRQMVFFYALVALAVVISTFGVVNTMAMSVFERRREIGVLRAIGARRWQVRRIVTDESLVIAGIAVVLGIAAGLGLGYVLVRAGISGGADVPFVVPWQMLGVTVLLGLVIGVAAAVLPARSAARLEIVEAIAYE